MSTAVVRIPCERVEFGQYQDEGPGKVASQTVRLFDSERCICVLSIVWPHGVGPGGCGVGTLDVGATPARGKTD